MDRNTVIGLFLLGLVLTVFSVYNQPSQAEIDAENKKIEQADKKKEVDEKKQKVTAEKNKIKKPTVGLNLTEQKYLSPSTEEKLFISDQNKGPGLNTRGQ